MADAWGEKFPHSHACSHCTLTSGVQVDAIVLESPYTNIREAAAHIPLTKVSPRLQSTGSHHGDRSRALRGSPSCLGVPPFAGKGCISQGQSLAPPNSLPGRSTASSRALSTSSWTRSLWLTCSSTAMRSECPVGRGTTALWGW